MTRGEQRHRSAAPAAAGRQGWLLLVHRTPARPSALRVRVWRRLKTLGAIPLHDGMALLPDSDEAEEDFQWLAVEVRERGGEAHVLRVAPLNAEEARRLRACTARRNRGRKVA
jgi:hypothetical protein